jgi:hypothetical protein
MKRFPTSAVTASMLYAGILVLLSSAPARAAEDPVLRADNAVVQALENGNQAAANRYLDRDFTWIDPQGVMWAKEDALRAGLKPLVGTGSDVKTVEHSYGNVVWVQISEKNHFSAHFWVRRPAGWRLLHMTEIAVHPRDFKTYRAPYDIPCINPCQVVPYEPLLAGEKAALDEWQTQESSQANWEKHVADSMDQRVVSTYGGVSPSKADRIAGMNRRRAMNPNAPTVGAAPALWIRTWDFGDAVVMISCQPTYGDKAYWSSRVLAPNKDGLWQMMESYHNYIEASPIMTAVPVSESKDPRAKTSN